MSHCSFNCISLMIIEVDNFFHVLIGYSYISSFVKCLFKSSVHFCLELFVLFLLNCRSLHILEASPSSDILHIYCECLLPIWDLPFHFLFFLFFKAVFNFEKDQFFHFFIYDWCFLCPIWSLSSQVIKTLSFVSYQRLYGCGFYTSN